ncbi:MAG: FAD-binding oxidoreductase [Syntrophales bacterium]
MASKDLLMDLIKTELMDITGSEDVSVSYVDRYAYSTDVYWVPRMWLDRLQRPSLPDFVVHPESAAEISRILKVANRFRLPVIPYGGGTGSQGGTVPLFGGIMLDLKKMNRIIRIDEKSLTVTAQAGINGQVLEWELNQRGLTLAHYPASEYGATLGGYIAARGSGTLSTKYGKAEDMVMSLEAVLPLGEIIRSLPIPSHSCGPDVRHHFVGSEGTMGVITEVTMRLDPVPEERRFRSYLFSDLSTGLEAGRRIMTQRYHPCTIRLYDPPSTQKFIKRVLGIDVDGSFMVTGTDGSKALVDLEEAGIDDICRSLGGRDLGRQAGEIWWKQRYDFYYPPFTPDLPELFGTVESTTTYDKILPLYEAKKKAIEEGYREWGATYTGHFSHWFPWGVMVYDRFYIKHPPQDAHEALQLHNMIWADAARASLAGGGVLNDHHGIGFKLGWLLPEQYGSAWQLLVNIKKTLDPNGIMNPGKLGFGFPG